VYKSSLLDYILCIISYLPSDIYYSRGEDKNETMEEVFLWRFENKGRVFPCLPNKGRSFPSFETRE
jgi:hypothetical protein